MSARTLLRAAVFPWLMLTLLAQTNPVTSLSPEAKAKAGARSRELIAAAPRLPFIAKELLLEPPSSGWELGMISWMSLDARGNIFLIQRGDKADPIVVVDRTGKVLRSWGKGMYKIPHSIRLDPQGNIWTVDAASSTVYKFSPRGERLLTIEVGGQPRTNSAFNGTTDIAFAGSRVFITDGYGNARVLEYTLDGRKVREWGHRGIGPGEFNLPHSIVSDGKKLWIADRENGRIQRFTLEGKYEAEFPVGKTYSLRLAGGLLYAALHPVDLPTSSPGLLVKLDKSTGRILGWVEMPEKSGLHSIDVTREGELLAAYGNHVMIYAKQ